MGASGPGRVLAAPGGCHGYPSPGQRDALPARCRFLPSIPRELGYPGWGSHIPPHTPGTPRVAWACSPRCAPRASLGQELSSPSTERGRIQRLRCPKSPQSPSQLPGLGCQMPPARGAACPTTFAGRAQPVCCPPQAPQPLQWGAALSAWAAQTGGCAALEQTPGPRILTAPTASPFSSAGTQKKEGNLEDGCSQHPQPRRPPPGHKSPFED